MSPIPAISCRDLAKRYDGLSALDGFDLTVERGAIVSLLGPSGCGKTTALRVIAGFEPADAGTVSVGDRIVFGDGIDVAADKRRVGMVFQDYALFPHMTVARNVAYGLDSRNPSGRVGDVLNLVGLSGLGARMPHELSGGEQQRVALARALAPEPEIVLLDEPFSNLDAPQRDRMRREVRRILTDAAATALFVTHDQEEALAIADTVAVMREGAVVQTGTPSEVYSRPADPWIASFLGDSVFLEGTAGLGGTVTTSLGTLAAAADEPGPVRVMVRPEWIIPTPELTGDSVVVDREYFGHDQMLLIERPDRSTVTCRVGSRPSLRTGDRVSLSIDEAVIYPSA
jgi:iron(III) transport system ATP-binding protein